MTRVASRVLFGCLSLIMAAVLAGCGYQIQRKASLPFGEITIGHIENRTVEPKLQDRLNRALTEEFLKQGLAVSHTAGRTLTAIVKDFKMTELSERADVALEYRVTITADFLLTDSEGKVLKKKTVATPFIVSFSAAKDLGGLIAARETAEEQAARDIAVEVSGFLLFEP